MRRETYSSLKAVGGAWRVAMGYMYRRPIDVMTVRCPGCGREVDLAEVGRRSGPTACRGCGGVVEVPGHLVSEARRQRVRKWAEERQERAEKEGWDPANWRGREGPEETEVSDGVRAGMWAMVGIMVLALVVMALWCMRG